MRFSAEPSKITRTCTKPGVISDSLAADWLQQFDDILNDLRNVLNKIS